MKLAWATDIHLNFVDGRKAAGLCDDARRAGASGMVLTGDIAEAPSLEGWLGLLAERFGGPIWFVLGNHDYYRGSIVEVGERMRALTAAHPQLTWMEAVDVAPLGPRAALVGVDGWGDTRLGDFARSTVALNDHVFIRELALCDDRAALGETLRALGAAAAARLRHGLAQALPRFEEVIVLTHVPPFASASWHEGRPSEATWLPFFACGATGEVLVEAADRWPRRRLRVLCGHTHSPGVVRVRPNLEVLTGDAEYGTPALAGVIDVPPSDGVRT